MKRLPGLPGDAAPWPCRSAGGHVEKLNRMPTLFSLAALVPLPPERAFSEEDAPLSPSDVDACDYCKVKVLVIESAFGTEVVQPRPEPMRTPSSHPLSDRPRRAGLSAGQGLRPRGHPSPGIGRCLLPALAPVERAGLSMTPLDQLISATRRVAKPPGTPPGRPGWSPERSPTGRRPGRAVAIEKPPARPGRQLRGPGGSASGDCR